MTEANGSKDPIDVMLFIASLGLLFLGTSIVCILTSLPLLSSSFMDLQGDLFVLASAAAFLIMTLSTLPVIFLSGRSLRGRRPPTPRLPSTAWLILIGLFPIMLILGNLAISRTVLPASFGLIAHIVAALAPVLVAVVIVYRYGPPVSHRRMWGQFLAGVWIMPGLAIVLELLSFFIVLLVLIVGLMDTPLWQLLLETASNPGPLVYQAFSDQIIPNLFQQPWVIGLILGYIALLVPIIEESVKSLAIWPLLRRQLQPREAFLSGVLGGAGFAFVEALLLVSPGPEWTPAMFARSGASLMHIFTAGITCWGIGQWIEGRRWKRLLGGYAVSIFMHGLWNFAAVGVAIAEVSIEAPQTALPLEILPVVSGVGIAVLLLLSSTALIGLIRIPYLLNRKAESTLSPGSPLVKE